MQRNQISSILKKDKHLVVTDGTLDDWIAQNMNLSLDNIDHDKISDLAPSIQSRLKKYIANKPKLSSGRPKGQPTLMDRLMKPTGSVERKRFKQKVSHQVETYKQLEPKVLYVHKDNLKYYQKSLIKNTSHVTTTGQSMMGDTNTSFMSAHPHSRFNRPRSSIEHQSRREKVIRNLFRRQVRTHQGASPQYEVVSAGGMSPREEISSFVIT